MSRVASRTPPHLIPKGGEELVSNGMPALRFMAPGITGLVTVRVTGPESWEWEEYKCGKPGRWWKGDASALRDIELTAPARRWVRYQWSKLASEPVSPAYKLDEGSIDRGVTCRALTERESVAASDPGWMPPDSPDTGENQGRTFDELLDASSLGSPEVKAAGASVSPEAVQRCLDRADELRAERSPDTGEGDALEMLERWFFVVGLRPDGDIEIGAELIGIAIQKLKAERARHAEEVAHLKEAAAPGVREETDQSGDYYAYCDGCGACLTDEDVEAHGWGDCIDHVRREESAGVAMQADRIKALESERDNYRARFEGLTAQLVEWTTEAGCMAGYGYEWCERVRGPLDRYPIGDQAPEPAIDWKARAEKAEAELALCRTRLGVSHDTVVSEAIRVSRLGAAEALTNERQDHVNRLAEEGERFDELARVIDDVGIWPSEEVEEAGDHAACVRHMAEELAKVGRPVKITQILLSPEVPCVRSWFLLGLGDDGVTYIQESLHAGESWKPYIAGPIPEPVDPTDEEPKA